MFVNLMMADHSQLFITPQGEIVVVKEGKRLATGIVLEKGMYVFEVAPSLRNHTYVVFELGKNLHLASMFGTYKPLPIAEKEEAIELVPFDNDRLIRMFEIDYEGIYTTLEFEEWWEKNN